MLRSIVSVVTGYLAMAIIVMIGTVAATAAMIPGGFAAARKMEAPPPRSYLYANLVLSFVAALSGGWITARLAPSVPIVHSAALALLLLLMSVVSAKAQGKNQPRWYPWTIAAIGAVGVLLGGLWELWTVAV